MFCSTLLKKEKIIFNVKKKIGRTGMNINFEPFFYFFTNKIIANKCLIS